MIDDEGRPHIVFRLDLNDLILRALGDDPYAFDKRKLAQATAPARDAMARAACKEDLREALGNMRAELRRIWVSELPVAEKKSLFFGLWDQCLEEGPADVVQVADQIRATILAFVAEKLPEASPLAYSAAELRTLNDMRTSKARFEPYPSR